MLQELLTLLPKEAETSVIVAAIVAAVVGLLLWITGARFSRQIIALIALAAGALIGLRLPDWCGWQVSGSAVAVGTALAGGVLGYWLHRIWIGLSLGSILALWAAMVTWVLLKKDSVWIWPEVVRPVDLAEYLKAVWTQVPPDMQRILPFASAMAVVSGFAVSILWPRVAVVLNWSAAGVTLIVGMGLAAVDLGRPQWLSMIPVQTWSQVTTLVGLVAFGAILQWQLQPAAAGPKPGEKKKKKSDDE